MNVFSGKKVLCFIALPHHNRFLVPIMNALQAQGMETIYFTAAAEGAFEITLNQAKLPYRHVLDYGDMQTGAITASGYRELRSVYQEKILSCDVFRAVPAVIQDKVIRHAVENFCCLNRMLEVEKPDLLFALHELNPWGKILGYLSHVHRIPYFTLQEGLYYADIHYYRFHTDFSTACMVWGNDCRRILLKAGCSDDKIFPVGNTHIWTAKAEATSEEAVRETRAALGIEPGRKIILFLMSHSQYQPFEARVFLDWIKARGDVTAVFKWHPVTNKEIVTCALEKVPKEAPVISVPDFDTYRLIGASDICVTVGNSTTGLEALAFGKPLLEVRLPDQEYSFVERGVAEPATGFEDLGLKCDSILRQGPSRERHARVQQYLADNFAYEDNRTMDRIVSLVSESLSARGTADSHPVQINAEREDAFSCSILLPMDNSPLETIMATLTSIAQNTPGELFEVIVIDCSARRETKSLLSELGGDVKIVQGEPDWNYSIACNRGVAEARGKYLAILKPGLVVGDGWLVGLFEAAEAEPDIGVTAGMTLNESGLIWHLGVAFDVNQTPFSIYRLLPQEFSGAQKRREFRAVEVPFVVSRELFCQLGGFSTDLSNRFEDVDFCLKVKRAGKRVIYTPASTVTRQQMSWQSLADDEQLNRIRFYSKWTGSIWQDDANYIQEDGLTHDALSALYRELAGRLAFGARQLSMAPAPVSLACFQGNASFERP